MGTDEELTRLAAELGAALQGRGWRLVTAESCTGGWVSKAITDVAGSSQWFDRGFVTYSNEAKVEQLSVSGETLGEHGAVSPRAVCEMARGALRHSHADIAVALTGIAGPDGGSPGKPVGTVWIAYALRDSLVYADRHCFPGDRESIRRAAVTAALRGLLGRLNSN